MAKVATAAKLVRNVPPLPQTERGAFTFISTDAPGDRLIYSHSNDVFFRPLAGLVAGEEKPEDIFCWRQHVRKVSCVSMSPNLNWVVSGDVEGKIKIWGAKGDNCQKNEFKLWDGIVKEAHWSGDNTRIVAAGDGKEVRAVAMIADTGSKTGVVGGHGKQVNSIAFKNQRPFRIVTGAEDNSVIFHEGPPFKSLQLHDQIHDNFVNCVRYAPDGNWVVSAGSDAKLFLYEGKAGAVEGEFEKPDGITGSLWRVEWSPDSTKVVTAGGDRKLRVWDREARKQTSEVKVGAGALEDMQIGLAWAHAKRIVSICLDARILIWDVADDGSLALAATVDGTQGPLTALACDAATGTTIRGGFDGHVLADAPDGKTKKAKIGKSIGHILGHSSAYSGPAEAWVFALDETARRVSLEDSTQSESIAIGELPVGVAWMDAEETKAIVLTSKKALVCIGTGGIEWRKENVVERTPTAFSYCVGGKALAVGIEKTEGVVAGVEQKNFDVAWFDVSGVPSPDTVVFNKVVSHHSREVSTLKFMPGGDILASGDAGGKISIWDASKFEVLHDFSNHTARVNSLDWLPGTRRVVSCSLDGKINVWDLEAKGKIAVMDAAHRAGATAVAAIGESSFASVGQDGFLSIWQL